jgi:hypothetical protein
MKLTPRVETLLEALLNEAGLSVGVDPRVFSHAVGEALMAMQQQRLQGEDALPDPDTGE